MTSIPCEHTLQHMQQTAQAKPEAGGQGLQRTFTFGRSTMMAWPSDDRNLSLSLSCARPQARAQSLARAASTGTLVCKRNPWLLRRGSTDTTQAVVAAIASLQ